MAAFEEVHEAAEKLLARDGIDAHPSFFETVTAMAFLAFARAGIEGTHAQAVSRCGLRRCRYTGLATTHLQHVITAVAVNLVGIADWHAASPTAKTRCSRFAAPQPTA